MPRLWEIFRAVIAVILVSAGMALIIWDATKGVH